MHTSGSVRSRIAKNSKPVEPASTVRQYLTFYMGRDLFAVDILVIKEILQYGELTEVPLTPPYLRGVINLRGAVVPVIDLAYRLGKGLTQEGKRTCIVIMDVVFNEQTVNLGMMVDAVSAVIEISPQQIEAVPALGGAVRTDFMAGMGKLESGFVIILDVTHVFTQDEAAALLAMKDISSDLGKA